MPPGKFFGTFKFTLLQFLQRVKSIIVSKSDNILTIEKNDTLSPTLKQPPLTPVMTADELRDTSNSEKRSRKKDLMMKSCSPVAPKVRMLKLWDLTARMPPPSTETHSRQTHMFTVGGRL